MNNPELTHLLKWSGTGILILGTFLNALGYYPVGPILLCLGGFLWLVVSIIWKEPAMIVTNFLMIIVGIIGLLLNISHEFT